MPAKGDITDLLGKPTEKETGLTEDSMNAMQQGLGLPNGEDNGEGNPLQKMDEISKTKDDISKQGDKKLDADILNQMFMTGDNKEGMFSPKVPEEIDGVKVHEDQDKDAKAQINGDKVEPKGKYKDQFKKDFLKHPDDYKLMTPKGEMTVAEAMHKGYDPLTKTFRKEHDSDAIKEKHLSKLNDADRQGVEKLLSPEAAQIAPADAGKYGLKENSPFVKQPPAPEGEPMPPTPAPQGEPAQAGPMPGVAGTPMPGSEESQMAGGQDLSALLGGKM